MKRRWLLAVLVVGVLAAGIIGGSVLAQDNGASGNSPVKSFVSRVAAILGLDEAQVQKAFDQAAREMQEAAIQQKLDRLVAQGRLTQEQADQYREWYQSRPEALAPGLPFGKFGGHGFYRGGRWGGGWHGMGFGKGPLPTPTPQGSGGT